MLNLNIFSLTNFIKVFPICLLSSASFVGGWYFLAKPNGSDSEQMLATIVAPVLLILFLFCYALQNHVIATEIIANEEDAEPLSIQESLAEIKSFLPASVGVILTFLVVKEYIIPTVGSMAGGIFQLSLGGYDINMLTFPMNLLMILWLFLATAEINSIGASFTDTIKYTMGFIFTNLLKCVAAIVFILFCWFVWGYTVYFTVGGSNITAMAIQIFVFAYLFGLSNTFVTSLFIHNVSEEDLTPDSELYED